MPKQYRCQNSDYLGRPNCKFKSSDNLGACPDYIIAFKSSLLDHASCGKRFWFSLYPLQCLLAELTIFIANKPFPLTFFSRKRTQIKSLAGIVAHVERDRFPHDKNVFCLTFGPPAPSSVVTFLPFFAAFSSFSRCISALSSSSSNGPHSLRFLLCWPTEAFATLASVLLRILKS